MTQTFTLTAIGISRAITGTLDDAIAAAIEIDAEYQRAFGVSVTDEGGLTVALVEDGKVERGVLHEAPLPHAIECA